MAFALRPPLRCWGHFFRINIEIELPGTIMTHSDKELLDGDLNHELYSYFRNTKFKY